jgi:hypothetical protein
VEVEAEKPEAFWCKRKWKHLEICCFYSVSKLLFEFWWIFVIPFRFSLMFI